MDKQPFSRSSQSTLGGARRRARQAKNHKKVAACATDERVQKLVQEAVGKRHLSNTEPGRRGGRDKCGLNLKGHWQE